MRTFTLQQSRTEVYTPNGGLALVGHCLNRHTSLTKTARTVVKRHGIPNIELIRTYLGLITLGKSDFQAAEPVRTDPFFKSALGIKQSPSSARLRQRFDEDAKALMPLLDEASVEFLRSVGAPVSPLPMGHVALDMDVFPMDNSQTHKEGVSYMNRPGYRGGYLD
ncbi:IS1380 family transposase [wastewater metagenome]|uniref:IS1380 family transposase ISMrsp6 n=2 Tax=unclassified sequences TaxID=12908 RepID=A0A5B8RC41_9ZZZZ|nr:IS1380 family transposase ISMrsp6 [uncultured organism]